MLGTPNPSNEMHNKIVAMVSLWRLSLYALLHDLMKEKYSEFIVNTLEKNLVKKGPVDTTDIAEVADIIAKEIGDPDVALELSDWYVSNTTIPILREKGISFRDVLLEPLKSFDITKPSVLLPSKYISQTDPNSDDVTLTLSQISLIDTGKTGWEQILEIRKDPTAIKNIRNLKLFVYSNYQDKSRAFIEDDIQKRLEDYHKTTKEHGFQLTLSALSTTLSSKNLLASVVAGLSTAFIGGPLIGVGTAAFIEIGNLAIEITKGYQAFTKIKNDHPLAYIIDVQDKLNK